jgi:mono/diheme cytochrome c family protein
VADPDRRGRVDSGENFLMAIHLSEAARAVRKEESPGDRLTERSMRSFFLSVLSLVLGVLWYQGTAAQAEGPPVSTSSPRTSSGSAMQSEGLRVAAGHYSRFCARCHGGDYTGNGWNKRGQPIPNFKSLSWQDSRSDAELFVSIVEGKGTHMPAFSDRLSESQARELVQLIRKANPNRRASTRYTMNEFENRFRELEKEWAILRRQFRELDSVSRRRAGTERRPGFSIPAALAHTAIGP